MDQWLHGDGRGRKPRLCDKCLKLTAPRENVGGSIERYLWACSAYAAVTPSVGICNRCCLPPGPRSHILSDSIYSPHSLSELEQVALNFTLWPMLWRRRLHSDGRRPTHRRHLPTAATPATARPLGCCCCASAHPAAATERPSGDGQAAAAHQLARRRFSPPGVGAAACPAAAPPPRPHL